MRRIDSEAKDKKLDAERGKNKQKSYAQTTSQRQTEESDSKGYRQGFRQRYDRSVHVPRDARRMRVLF